MSPTKHKLSRGFTLIEMMVTITISAILLTVVAPNMRNFIVSNRLTSNANEIIGALGLARSEAVRRNQRVVFCAVAATNGVPDTSGCVNPGTASWAGWMIFEDTQPANGARDAGEEVIRAGVFPGGTTQVLASSNLRDASKGNALIDFRPDGIAKPHGSSTTIQQLALGLCDVSSSLAENARTINLVFGSRVSVARSKVTSCAAPADPS